MRVFLYECVFEGNRLSSEKLQCHLNFIFHIMFDKVALVCGKHWNPAKGHHHILGYLLIKET